MRNFEFGEVVDSKVVAIESWGLMLCSDGVLIQVQIPEIAWVSKPFQLESEFPLGSITKVKILRFNPTDKIYIGSICRAKPEENPYLQYASRGIGMVYEARVIALDATTPPAWGRLALPDGVKGKCWLMDSELKVGDTIRVFAMEVDAANRIASFHVGEPPAPRTVES